MTAISEKLKVSNILLLILAGIIIGQINYNGEPVFNLPNSFMISIAIIALVMIVFDGSSRMSFKKFDKLSYGSIQATLLFMLFNLLFLGLSTYLLFFNNFTTTNIIFSLVFAILMSGTDPGSIFILLQDKANKVLDFLKVESIINTPLIVLIPFMLLEFVTENKTISILTQIGPFVQQIITGVGAGIVIGLIMFKSMKKVYSEQFSPVALLTTTLITYIVAENLGGNGILGVATLGLLFGNMYVKKKVVLTEFNSMLSASLEILVFVLVGIMVKIPLEIMFFAKLLILYVVLILCRYLALKITFLKDENINKKRLMFMTLNMPKGIAVASVAFTLALQKIQGMQTLINLIMAGTILSLIVSTIITKYSKYFLENPEKTNN